jgi:nitrite reductase/ring-hydroxylating ferredoxin subunit
MFNNTKIRKIFIIALLFISFIGCDKYDDGIPNIRFQKSIGLIELADVGLLQAAKFPGGVNGIIIFRLGDNEFKAYERTCPYEVSSGCLAEAGDNQLIARCPCCGSEFNLVYGDLNKGPSRWPLKQYRAVVSGQMLHISN